MKQYEKQINSRSFVGKRKRIVTVGRSYTVKHLKSSKVIICKTEDYETMKCRNRSN